MPFWKPGFWREGFWADNFWNGLAFQRAGIVSGLILHHMFEDSDGASGPLDSTGNYTATFTGISLPTDRVTGKHGNGLQVSGNGDYFISPNIGLDYTDPQTTCWWSKVSGGVGANNFYVASTRDFSNARGAFSTYQSPTGVLYARFGNLESAGYTHSDFNDGEWHHYAIGHDGAGNAKIYVNGVLVLEPATVANNGTWYPDDYTLNTGRAFSHTRDASRQIDDLRVYNRLLSASDVLSLYQWKPPVRDGIQGLIRGNIKEVIQGDIVTQG